MRRAFRSGFVVLLAAFPPLALRAQATGDPRLDRESARAVQALTDSARAEGLPAKALTGVLQEGLSQHANGTRIVRAVQEYLHALRGASAALGPNSSETEMVSGAGDLLAGIPPATLTQLRSARGKEPVVVPLVVLGDLIARGVPVAAAAGAIVDAAKRGLPDQQLSALRERVEHDISSGVAAGVALESVTRTFLAPPMSSADSTARRRKPPGDPNGFARVELDQVGAGPTDAARDLRADAMVRLGSRAPFEFSADARALDGAAVSGPAALLNTSFLAAAENGTSGIAAGPGARLISAEGASWFSPALRAIAWHQAGAWRLSLDAAFGGVPTRPAAGVAAGGGLSLAMRTRGGARFDVVQSDTPIVHQPPITPTTPVYGDSIVKQTSSIVPGTATEARFSIARRLGRFELVGSAGIRAYAARRNDTWSSASVAVALFDRLGVVAGGITGPENVLSPIGGTRFFAGIRLATGPSFASAPSAPAEKANVVFRVVPGAVTTTLELRAPSARSVELVGDFTDWVPLALSTSGGGEWSVTRAIEPGVHRVRVRINGGEWSAPPGLPRSVDVFGGEVGMLTIGTR